MCSVRFEGSDKIVIYQKIGVVAYMVNASVHLGLQDSVAHSADVYRTTLLRLTVKEALIGLGVVTETPIRVFRANIRDFPN